MLLLMTRSCAASLLVLALASCDSPPVEHPPTATLEAPATCDLGGSMRLDATSSTDPGGDIVLYRFTVADGTASREETQPVIDQICRTAGLIEVAVEVVDSNGSRGRAAAVVSVRRP